MAGLVLALFLINFHPNTIHSNFRQFWTILWPVWLWRYFDLIFTLILYTLLFDNSGLFCGQVGFGVIFALF